MIIGSNMEEVRFWDVNMNEPEERDYFYDEILCNVDEDDQAEVFDKDD